MMNEQFKLPPRLALIASFVPDGAHLADVGTDHGLLPIRLLLDGRIQAAVATDIRPGPLSRAQENAEMLAVNGLRCVLCDGLSDVSPDDVDTVAIAGMGGENITAILRNAPWACEHALLILQPMSRPEELRTAFRSLGLRVQKEQLVRDNGRVYSVMVVSAGEPEKYSCGELYCGKYSLLSSDALFPEFLEEQERHLQAAVQGLERSSKDSDGQRLDMLRSAVADIQNMRRKCHAERA